jgi:hypothetical protein
VKRPLCLAVSLFFAVCFLSSGCARTEPDPQPVPVPEVLPSGYVRGMESPRWLTDAEKERVVEIALGTPQAIEAKETYGTYRIILGWVGIVWRVNHASELWGIDYEMVDNVPDNVPQSAEYYSRVDIYFGEPERVLLRVAVNPDTGKVAHVEAHGLKILPK